MTRTRKDLILGFVADAALDFAVYDRKESTDLPLGAIEDALDAGQITVKEIADTFGREMLRAMGR